MDTIFGILKLDHPTLSDDEHRQIQLGELDVLPDGTTVAEYAQKVEALKEANLANEALERELYLLSLAEDQPTKQEQEEPEESSDLPDETDTETDVAEEEEEA